jgi:aryl-alcohol dehydrogenase-like predicted oxidoreductase
MKYRELGRTGIQVSEIGFGAWGIGGEWGSRDDQAAAAALERAFDLGITFYDTAHVYGDGVSEFLIGSAFHHCRDRVVIATKIPPKTYRWPVLSSDSILDTFPGDWIVKCTEESLRRLRTDYIDVQQLHAWTPNYTEADEWFDALTRLKDQGKIRAFGVSVNDWDPYGGVGLIESGRTDTVQVIYNIFEQRPEERLLPAAQEHNVGVIVRVPFEEGLLTGKLRPGHVFDEGDWRGQWLDDARLAEAAERVGRLEEFLGTDRHTLPILALKFCLSHPAVSTVIPGMRRVEHVEQNVLASVGEPLPEAVRSELKNHAFVHGWAYPWSDSDLVTVATFMAGAAEADLARARLEAAGIEAFIMHDTAAVTTPVPIASVDLQVRRAQAERAMEVLQQPGVEPAVEAEVEEQPET